MAFKSNFIKESTEKMENQLKRIIDEKPDEAKYCRVIDKDNRSIGGMLGTVSCWTSHNCRYTDENGETVKEIQLTTHDSRWEEKDSLNYLLYMKGLYKLRYDGEYESIRGSYEGEIDAGIIYPINNLHSPKSRFQRICDYIVRENKSNPAPVTLTFVCDYDYAETEIKYRMSEKQKREYSICAKIEYDGQETHTRPMNYTTVSILFRHIYEQLINNGVEVIVGHEMENDDKDFMMGHHTKWWS